MSIYHTWILQGHSILSINLLAWPIMRSYRAETRDPGDGSARVDEGGLGLPVGKGWCFSFLSWRILVGCWLLVGLEGGILRGLLNSFWFFAGGNNIRIIIWTGFNPTIVRFQWIFGGLEQRLEESTSFFLAIWFPDTISTFPHQIRGFKTCFKGVWMTKLEI